MRNMKIMGVDFGDKRTGIAISSSFGNLASPLETIFEADYGKVAHKIAEIARDNSVEKIIVGLPKNMNGTLGPRAQKTVEFGNFLAEVSGVAVEYLDERMTTIGAERFLNVCDVKGKKRKQIIDTVSAVVILQNYLDKGGITNG